MEFTHIQDNNSMDDEKKKKAVEVRLKKQLGLLEGVAVILGIIFGSGIFVSPQGVIREVGSVGLSLIIWMLCGALSTIGALCYAELGTCIPKSGGDYVYIHAAFGELSSFLYLWAANLIFVPTTNAIMGLTFAKYILQPFFPNCSLPTGSPQIIAGLTICSLTFINCLNVNKATKMQNVIMFAKISALVLIIIIGIYWLGIGHTENYVNIFKNTSKEPGKIAVAIYSGIFSYSGWNYLNFMTEELKNPYGNLPRAIYISLPLVTLIYVLANVAYLAVLDSVTMISSDAIAVTLGNKTMGGMAWIIPLLVAISAFGGLSVHIMTSSRMCFVGARNGHFPTILSHLNINKLTPVPALIFLCVLSLMMLCTDNIFTLITYCSIVESFFITLSVSGILWMRYSRPDIKRPIKVSLWIPFLFVCICLFLVIFSCYYKPWEVIYGTLITLTGIPVYFICITWKNKPIWFHKLYDIITITIQKLLITAKED